MIILNILKNPTPLIDDVVEINDILFNVNFWDKLAYACLILFGVVVIFSMILMLSVGH